MRCEGQYQCCKRVYECNVIYVVSVVSVKQNQRGNAETQGSVRGKETSRLMLRQAG